MAKVLVVPSSWTALKKKISTYFSFLLLQRQGKFQRKICAHISCALLLQRRIKF